MPKIKEEDILKGIRQHDIEVLDFVYKRYFKHIRFFVNNNNGDDEDAKDIYQEALIVIYKKIKYKDLEITCSFKTYLFSVCRLIWLKQLEKTKGEAERLPESFEIEDIDEKNLVYDEKRERVKLFQEYFLKMSDDCRKVLEMSLQKITLKKIAEIMGYKTEAYAKKRRYQCKEKLVNEIKSDPRYKELL